MPLAILWPLLNIRAARLGMEEDERHGLELDDQRQTVTCAGMALKS